MHVALSHRHLPPMKTLKLGEGVGGGGGGGGGGGMRVVCMHISTSFPPYSVVSYVTI